MISATFYRKIKQENRIVVPIEIMEFLDLTQNELVEITITKAGEQKHENK